MAERPRRRNGFGLAVDLHDAIEGEGLGDGHGAGLAPPTAVRVVPDEAIDEVWPAHRAHTTREVRVGGELVFDVAYAAGAGYLLRLPAYGRFLIAEDGMEILSEPGEPDAWEGGLAVQALPIAATVRGVEPFHAAGVAIGDGAVLVTGTVTAGKSSLAAALVEEGGTLLSDDVVAVQDPVSAPPLAHPAERWLHLRPPEDTRPRRRLEPAGMRDGRARFRAPLAPGPVPLRAIYFLDRAGSGEPLEPLEAPALPLLGATYNLSVRDPARLRRQLDLCQRLSQDVPAFRLHVSPDRDAAELGRALAAHAASLPA